MRSASASRSQRFAVGGDASAELRHASRLTRLAGRQISDVSVRRIQPAADGRRASPGTPRPARCGPAACTPRSAASTTTSPSADDAEELVAGDDRRAVEVAADALASSAARRSPRRSTTRRRGRSTGTAGRRPRPASGMCGMLLLQSIRHRRPLARRRRGRTAIKLLAVAALAAARRAPARRRRSAS